MDAATLVRTARLRRGLTQAELATRTGTSQPVPPLRAELLDESKTKVIHSWMISPPVDTLSPNESSTFHSAEMGVPEGGKFLRVRLSTAG